MKKVSAILLALVLALSMVVFAAADVKADVDAFIKELSAVADADEIKAAVNEALDKADVTVDTDAADITEAQAGTVADTIIAKFNLEGEKAEKVQKAMSNDFVSFLAGLYIGAKVESPADPPDTGSSAVIAIAAFATISMAAAAAFVTSKKED